MLKWTYQFQHPWATTACSKASKEAKNNNSGAGSDEHIGGICGILSNEGDVGAQSKLSPDSNSQQDHPSDLQMKEKTAWNYSQNRWEWTLPLLLIYRCKERRDQGNLHKSLLGA